MHIESWEWDDANKVWVKAPAVVVSKRMTAAGQVAAGAHKLYWLLTRPVDAGNLFTFSDDTTGLTAIVLDGYMNTKDSLFVCLNPPMPFTTGIYLKQLNDLTSITVGYV